MTEKFKRLRNRLMDYMYDPNVDIKNKSFILFSFTALIALFLAIPCGLIMREPLSATISTITGTVFFTAYVAFAIKKKRIYQARIFISIVLVFVFLPSMFFTNGGVYGGTPVWLLLGTIYIAIILEGRMKIVMLILNVIVMLVCWLIGYYNASLVMTYTKRGNYIDTFSALVIISMIIYVLISFQNNLLKRDEENKNIRKLFEQTATALVNAIDAKDRYTHGHSARVAEYSKKIAKQYGLSAKECDDIYYVALLHDVGKIGIPENIINKDGKLTDEEYKIVKNHPVLGAQILEGITEIPFIGIGAKYHHERYDGKGYPDKLIGTDIPEYARIIAVADAYDAMTSMRSYRDPIPQQQVREEIVKGIGSQFDPEFARIMIHLIDMDIEYKMKERKEIDELDKKGEITIIDHRSEVYEGIYLYQNMINITLKVSPGTDGLWGNPRPSLVLFDSLDGRYHDDEISIKELNYFEYGEIWFDGTTTTTGARKMQVEVEKTKPVLTPARGTYRIQGLRIKDHALIKIIGYDETITVIVALPDSARFAYIGLTGQNCKLADVMVYKSEKESPEHTIPRIAEEVTYINGPSGDLPNVQIDGYRTDATKGVPIKDGMKITFHGLSLPTARLVWHCPFINIFTSDNGLVNGPNFKDYMLMRLDGECWEGDPRCEVIINSSHTDDFDGWDAWKAYLKEGFDCTFTLERKGFSVTVRTENNGIVLKNTAVILDQPDELYVSLSGDQVAITNIRIND